jgi:hypothetical protein
MCSVVKFSFLPSNNICLRLFMYKCKHFCVISYYILIKWMYPSLLDQLPFTGPTVPMCLFVALLFLVYGCNPPITHFASSAFVSPATFLDLLTSALKIEAVCPSGTLVPRYQNTQCHDSEDGCSKFLCNIGTHVPT